VILARTSAKKECTHDHPPDASDIEVEVAGTPGSHAGRARVKDRGPSASPSCLAEHVRRSASDVRQPPGFVRKDLTTTSLSSLPRAPWFRYSERAATALISFQLSLFSAQGVMHMRSPCFLA
jgi:hypothetical protein